MGKTTTMAIGLVALVAVALFFYKLGQQSTPAPQAPREGIESGLGGDFSNIEPVPAQPSNVPPKHVLTDGGKAGMAPGGRIAHFEIGNRNVKSIYADGDVLWFGTSGGVIRYDSKTDDYTVFNNKTPGVLSNGIFHVSKIDDLVVVGSYGGGMSILDPASGQWRNYNIPQGLADQFVYDVTKASNGDWWIATWSGANRVRGGKLDDPSAWETFTVESTGGGLPNPWVYGVEEGRDGEVWFATEAGLARFKNGEWTNWQHDDGLGAPYEKVKDAIQFTNDPAKASKHHAQQKSEQGLDEVDVAYNPNYIISIEVDKNGNVWCGTWGGGLAKFDGERWTNFTSAEGLPGNHIFMLYEDTHNQIWVGTSKGVSLVDEQGHVSRTLTMSDGLYADNVFSMANAADGSVWVGSFGGAARFSQSAWPL